MYWIPKLHKKPYKARFISNSRSCTTTNISILLTSCIAKFKDHVELYCDKACQNSDINLFWSIKNSTEGHTRTLGTKKKWSLADDVYVKQFNCIVSSAYQGNSVCSLSGDYLLISWLLMYPVSCMTYTCSYEQFMTHSIILLHYINRHIAITGVTCKKLKAFIRPVAGIFTVYLSMLVSNN